jgi:hypothetical protein
MCNPNNTEGIKCETDKTKVEALINNLYFEMYALQKINDINSNSMATLKANGGIENRLNPKSNWLGTFKA